MYHTFEQQGEVPAKLEDPNLMKLHLLQPKVEELIVHLVVTWPHYHRLQQHLTGNSPYFQVHHSQELEVGQKF